LLQRGRQNNLCIFEEWDTWENLNNRLEIAGELSDGPELDDDGTNEKMAGNVQEKVGQVKKVVGK
jgi:uncharacterized protein YjbJ (UPF0337 family)